MDSGGAFPFPILLTWGHMLTATVVMHNIRAIQPAMLPGLQAHGKMTVLKAAAPIAVLFAMVIVLANCSLLFLSVSYINFVKCGNPVFALGVAFVLGTMDSKSCTLPILAAILTMSSGMALTTKGTMEIHLVGVFMLFGSIILEQIRIVLFKKMLSTHGLQLDPLSALAAMAPVALAVLSVPLLLLEGISAPLERLKSNPLLVEVLALNLLTSVALNLAYARLLKVASPVTFTVFGTLKDSVTAFLAMFLQG